MCTNNNTTYLDAQTKENKKEQHDDQWVGTILHKMVAGVRQKKGQGFASPVEVEEVVIVGAGATLPAESHVLLSLLLQTKVCGCTGTYTVIPTVTCIHTHTHTHTHAHRITHTVKHTHTRTHTHRVTNIHT